MGKKDKSGDIFDISLPMKTTQPSNVYESAAEKNSQQIPYLLRFE